MAAAWVTLKHLGQDGYMKTAKKLQETTQLLIEGVTNIQVSIYRVCRYVRTARAVIHVLLGRPV